MDGISLVRATTADIPLISALAEKVWFQHYPSIISMEQIRFMLDKMYSSQSLHDQMQNKSHVFYLVRMKEDAVGFISVNHLDNNRWFLNKFYIDQDKAAQGIGSKAFAILLKEINPKNLRLTVNRQNYKAINFYFRNGFRIAEVADFDIGDGYFMNDFVMEANF